MVVLLLGCVAVLVARFCRDVVISQMIIKIGAVAGNSSHLSLRGAGIDVLVSAATAY